MTELSKLPPKSPSKSLLTKNMSHMARLLRPRRFLDVIGQDVPVGLIKTALRQGVMFPVCTIFGPSGIGKTTLARLIAMWECCTNRIEDEPCGQCENCTAILSDTHPDVFELDGGTYTSVEDIKSMLQSTNYATSAYNKNNKRIYILDEVHMLSKHAITALLKKFEEPMQNLQFVLATTNVEKLPDTILSRSFPIRLESLDENTLSVYIKKVCEENECAIDQDSVSYISYAAHGSMRQALSLLEQVGILCGSNIEGNRTRKILGLTSYDMINEIISAFEKQDVKKLFAILGEAKDIQPMMLMKQLINGIQAKIQAYNSVRLPDNDLGPNDLGLEQRLKAPGSSPLQGNAVLLIKIGYELAEASIVMHKSPYSNNILEICLGYALIKHMPNPTDRTDEPRKPSDNEPSNELFNEPSNKSRKPFNKLSSNPSNSSNNPGLSELAKKVFSIPKPEVS